MSGKIVLFLELDIETVMLQVHAAVVALMIMIHWNLARVQFVRNWAKLEFESIRSISILIFNVAVRLCMRT